MKSPNKDLSMVQSIIAVNPELYNSRHEPESIPVEWAGDGFAAVLLSNLPAPGDQYSMVGEV